MEKDEIERNDRSPRAKRDQLSQGQIEDDARVTIDEEYGILDVAKAPKLSGVPRYLGSDRGAVGRCPARRKSRNVSDDQHLTVDEIGSGHRAIW
jgi:hypothetical protein